MAKQIQPNSLMRRVLSQIAQGNTNRYEMAKLLEADINQIHHAVENLKKRQLIELVSHQYDGSPRRKPSIYRVKGTMVNTSPYSDVSFIFWYGDKKSG